MEFVLQDRLFQLAVSYLESNRPDQCIAQLNVLLRQCPNDADAWLVLGDALRQTGENEQAKQAYAKSVVLHEEDNEALVALAELHASLNEHEEALSIYQKLAAQHPDHPELHHNIGLFLQALERPLEAEQEFKRVLQLDPSHVNAAVALGQCLYLSERYQELVQTLTPVVKQTPESSSLHLHLGKAYLALQDQDSAVQHLQRVAEIEPENVAVLNYLGVAYREQYEHEKALPCFERCVSLDAENGPAIQNLFQTWRDLCDWTDWDRRLGRFMERCRRDTALQNTPPVAPFYALGLPFTQQELTEISRLYGRQYEQPEEDWIAHKEARERPSRLHIGYVSSNCHDHPGNHLICGLFAKHDRDRFQVSMYSFGGESDSPYRQRVVDGCDQFIDITSLSDHGAAQRIANDEVDILVDLKGYTRNHRPGIFCYRPAPVRVGFLGYAGSTGLPSHQFILTDRIVSPESMAADYSEELIYLPHQYQVNDDLAAVSSRPVDRSEEGLPESAVVFCCFNQNYKIEPEIFSAWMRILQRVPNSVLWLLRYSRTVQERLRVEAELRGVDGERLIFCDRKPRPEHLARQRLADLFLDTYYYNAHTTATDALRMGVPLITCEGRTFASRVASSLLHAAGLPQLAVESFEQYEDLAVALANDKDQREAHRDYLLKNALESPLLNTAQFARDIEACFDQMWSRVQVAPAV